MTKDTTISGLLHEVADVQILSAAEALRRFEIIEARITGVEKSVGENTKITSEIAGDTTELLDLFKSVKGGFTVMGWLGRLAKWVAGFAAAFAAIYAIVQNIRGVK